MRLPKPLSRAERVEQRDAPALDGRATARALHFLASLEQQDNLFDCSRKHNRLRTGCYFGKQNYNEEPFKERKIVCISAVMVQSAQADTAADIPLRAAIIQVWCWFSRKVRALVIISPLIFFPRLSIPARTQQKKRARERETENVLTKKTP